MMVCACEFEYESYSNADPLETISCQGGDFSDPFAIFLSPDVGFHTPLSESLSLISEMSLRFGRTNSLAPAATIGKTEVLERLTKRIETVSDVLPFTPVVLQLNDRSRLEMKGFHSHKSCQCPYHYYRSHHRTECSVSYLP